ncbi:heme transporter FLVCR2-like isoform X2 [Phymastichus coffea]|nr:heme transporter FLVCR2-like isoform X2 [Phymastichus coffea]XP_058794851.1 heme transporter FLVCR2-like isoform X2 [Phymastichus coffea]XP_058794852.1 heme transporter FLVCR2-like isoform X2 [Phymastichus coffea]
MTSELARICTEEKSQVQLQQSQPQQSVLQIKVYKRRWLMLGLYMFYAGLVCSQWIQYSIVSNIIAKYYDVSMFLVDCTSMIFMLLYAIFIFPVTYLSEKIGLRWSIVLGSALCCLGSWIKTLSVSPDRFYLTLVGQAVAAISLTIMLPLPGRVGAKWFGSDEISTATSVGIFGSQLGISASFLLGPVIVKNHDNKDDIGSDLSVLSMSLAIAATINLILCTLFFQEEPKLPPNETRALQKTKHSQTNEEFIESMKRLFTNKSFLILCNSYGLNVGTFNAISTMLNQLFLIHFKNGEQSAGRIGLLLTLTGMFGSITFGIILDKTHKFKLTTVIVYFLTFLGQIFFAVAIFMEVEWMVYASSIFLGFFMSGYLALGYEMAAEYTYPESEAIPGGLLNITNNIYGVILILVLEKVLECYGDVLVHVIFCGVLLLGLILTIMTKDEHRRQDAKKAAEYQGIPQDEIRDKTKVEEGHV